MATTGAMAADDDPRAWLEGTPYRPTAVLGRGAMGIVLGATHEQLGVNVCIKVLRPEATGQPGLIDRFRLEAQALAKLGGGTHPNLVHVRDFGSTAAGRWYLVMERLDGRTFEDERRSRGPVPWQEAVGYVVQALTGLAVAHAAGLLHRDVKPANLFLCDASEGETRRVKVLDFGIAKLAELATIASEVPRLSHPTEAGVTLGTPRYMSPEQLAGRPLDARMDVYAMGLVLWSLVTGRLPHEDARGEELVRAQVQDELPRASSVAPVPVALDALIARATAKRRDGRPRDAAAFREELEQLLERERGSLRVPTPPGTGPQGTTPLPRQITAETDDRTQALPARALAPGKTIRLEPPVVLATPMDAHRAATSAPSMARSVVPDASTVRMVAGRPATGGVRSHSWLFAAATIAATLLFTALGGAVLGWCSP